MPTSLAPIACTRWVQCVTFHALDGKDACKQTSFFLLHHVVVGRAAAIVSRGIDGLGMRSM